MLQDVYNLASLISRQATDDDEFTKQQINIFIAFHLFGLFGTLIMVLTVLFSRSTSRDPIWFSFALSWIISTVSYSLLFWGRKLSGEPGFSFCLIQGIMIYAAPPLTAATSLALVIQIWFLVTRSVIAGKFSKAGRLPPMWSTILLISPYILYISILLGTLAFGIQNTHTVRKVSSGMYCNFASLMPGRLCTFLVAFIMIPAVVLEIHTCMSLHRQWTHFKHQKDPLSMIIRVVLFTCIGILAVGLSLVFFFKIHHGAELNIVISTLPVSVVLLFGTQADLIRAWMFWRKQPISEKQEIDFTNTELPIDSRPHVIDIHV